ncbi:ABC transporter permease [Amycolatopsis sp. NPDC059027]|uniref:ABC transporter permease n=1 Tax=unclassified Amycolatopsis TaxID=2618356 RepID=UPI00366E6526
MAARSYALTDSMTMLRRNLRRMIRYPTMIVMIIGMPVIFLLLFVYVFGGTLGAGLGTNLTAQSGGSSGRAEYVNYVSPAIMLMTVTAVVQGTSASVATDMTEGIIARFRTMSIARVSVLTGHVLGSMIQTVVGVAVVTGVELLVGFRPAAGVGGWFAAFGILMAAAFALIWLSVALGQASNTVETASNLPLPLMLLIFLGSGFVPPESMPAGLRWFAEYQPFTSIIETLRSIFVGTPVGSNAIIALSWCVVIALGGYLWSRKLYNREYTR